VIWQDAQLSNSIPDSPPTDGGSATIQYTLIAYNNAGETDTRQATVRVAEAPPQNLLANTTWQLVSMQEGDDIPPEVSITAYFSPDGSLSGSSGCNSYIASYASNGEEIIINPPSGGGPSCGEPFDNLEGTYLELLPQTANFEINGKLILRNNGGQKILSFTRIG
jgi:heat shock protein HslJ